MQQLTVFAHTSNGKGHFFFFFFFRFRMPACARKASARAFICPETNSSAVSVAARSAVSACLRICLDIFIGSKSHPLDVVPPSDLTSPAKALRCGLSHLVMQSNQLAPLLIPMSGGGPGRSLIGAPPAS